MNRRKKCVGISLAFKSDADDNSFHFSLQLTPCTYLVALHPWNCLALQRHSREKRNTLIVSNCSRLKDEQLDNRQGYWQPFYAARVVWRGIFRVSKTRGISVTGREHSTCYAAAVLRLRYTLPQVIASEIAENSRTRAHDDRRSSSSPLWNVVFAKEHVVQSAHFRLARFRPFFLPHFSFLRCYSTLESANTWPPGSVKPR